MQFANTLVVLPNLIVQLLMLLLAKRLFVPQVLWRRCLRGALGLW